MSGRLLLIAWGFALVLAGIAAALVLASDHEDNKAATLALALTVGLSFVGSGLIALWRRPKNTTGFLLALVGYLWFFGALSESNSDWVFTIGGALGSAAFGAFVHLLLAFPSGRLEGRRDRMLVVLTYVLVVGGGIALMLVDRTPNSDCPECTSTIAVADSGTAESIAVGIVTALELALAATILFLVARRYLRASPTLRRALGPVLASGSLSLLVLTASVVVQSLSDDAAQPLEIVFLAVFAMVPVAFLAGVLRSRLARSGVGDLLLELARGTPIRDALAKALADPTLEVAYWSPEQGRYATADGKPLAENGDPRHVTLVEHGGRPTAALVHDPMLADERELVESVSAAAALWLDNERLQGKLRAQYEFLETTVNAVPSLLCSLDREGRIANLNEASRRASGLPDEEDVRWQPFWDVYVAPDEREAARQRFEDAAPDHEATSFEHTFVNREGEERTIAWSTAPIADAQGHVAQIICGGLDITERRQREQELEVERDFASTVANTIPIFLVGVWDDASVNSYGPNPAFEHNLGWTREDTRGRNLLDFVHPEDRYLAGMAIASAANGVPSERRESRWLHKDGSARIVSWSAREILGMEGRTVVLVSGADVTERYRQEEEIRASRARIVQAGDAERRRLERNLHDGAQQRLVALSLSLRLAQSKLKSDPAGADAVLEASREELAAALDELRELARGIHPAILTDRGLPAALEALASRSPVPVEFETAAEALPGPVEAAAYYVIAEALANVVKYAGASEVKVRVGREDEYARISVEDDGTGGADATNGSGLRGLADRVAALEGTLEIHSPPGGGTRITAEIPLQQ
ncbi:MAG: PAS domain-containing sensor histidine kinase [Gaiellaceae bacterium]